MLRIFERNDPRGQSAFGKVQAYCKYELFMERYRSAAEFFGSVRTSAGTKGLDVLDVGSGTGLMKQFADGADMEWHGIEIDPDRIKICENLGYKIVVLNLDSERFSFDDATFDIVVALHVLEHTQEPERIIGGNG